MLALALVLAAFQADPNDLSARVEIIRTAHGVPHIRAEDLKAFGYGLAWIQLEDYGPGVAHGILRTRGTLARVFGRDSIENDFFARPDRKSAETIRNQGSQRFINPETKAEEEWWTQLAFSLPRVAELDREEIRASVIERFSAKRMADGYEALYRRMLAEARGENAPVEDDKRVVELGSRR